MARGSVGLGLALAVVVSMSASAAGAPLQTCSVPNAIPAPPIGRPHEVLHIRVMPGLVAANGTLTVSFAPTVATDRLVFRLWPNSPFYARLGAALTVSAVGSGEGALPAEYPDPTTLVIRRPIAANQRITVSMDWALRLPRRAGIQLHGGRSARLVSFFPTLAWNGHGWATDPPVATDSFWPTSPTADFDVDVQVPAGLQVLATGTSLGRGRWHARAVRDFALAIGPFRIARATVAAPRRVQLTVGLERGSGYRLQDFVSEAARVLRFYSRHYGGYPWTTYSIAAMTDPTGLFGTAYPTLGFLGDGSLALVPHETAHQWFYSLVGNDQARDPWLSEGLATWAQTGPEQSLASMVNTSVAAPVLNRIGEPMSFWSKYDFETFRAGLYVQTAQALASLGPAAKVSCALRSFVTRNAYRTAVPEDLLRALKPFFPSAERKLRARGAHFGSASTG
jgi:Peptidase family M1 domain